MRSPLTPPVSVPITTHYHHSRLQEEVPCDYVPHVLRVHHFISLSLPPSLPSFIHHEQAAKWSRAPQI